ncbi:MAG: DUF2975 domain-containing protein [Clostridiales bacterium]|nr:DUF2975 domain-containing protein [Clostridiales bacterium]
MKKETLLLKIAIAIIGLTVLALSIAGLFWLPSHPASSSYAHLLYPIIIMMYVSAIPFFIALYKSFNLLFNIDKDMAFSKQSTKELKGIKYCAIIICALYVVMMPFVFLVADKDDAPGLIIFWMIPIFVSAVFAIFTSLFQKLLTKAH